jgi:hypothetical protein
MTGVKKLPAAAVLAVGALLLVALQLPGAQRGWIGGGAAFVLSTYAQAFSIVALGIALSQVPRRPAGVSLLLFAAGFLLGVLIKDRVLAALVARPGAFEQTRLIAPAGCILSGIALAVTGRAQALAVPAVAVLAGIAIGFVAALNDPTFGETGFALGAAVASFWLLAAPLPFVPRFEAPPVRIASRILASWLVAIGLMLGAAKFFERKPAPPVAPPPATPAERFALPKKPGLAPHPAPTRPPPLEGQRRGP